MRGLSDDLGPGRRGGAGRPLHTVGALFFAGLSLAAVIEALRGAPLPLGGGAEASAGEALLYRICAALTCAALGGWLALGDPPERRGDDGLLR